MAFQKGKSGNPLGRPKGSKEVRTIILEKTRNGLELVEIMLEVARGGHPEAKASDVVAAVRWLGDYAFGKPVQPMEHSGSLSLEQLVSGANGETGSEPEGE